MIVAIDEATLNNRGGPRAYRTILARGSMRIAAGKPAVVAIDMVLADAGDPREDQRLAEALQATSNLVLPAEFIDDGHVRGWENPLPRFARFAAAIGNVRADEESHDGVTRSIALEKTFAHQRHWALALEAFRLAKGVRYIVESPREIQVGTETIPLAREGDHRSLRIRYTAAQIPKPSLESILENPGLAGQLHNKIVFLGVTATNDRVVSPTDSASLASKPTLSCSRRWKAASSCGTRRVLKYSAGVFLSPRSRWPSLLTHPAGERICWALPAAYLAHALPVIAFQHNVVFPYSAPFAVAWLCVSAAASYQHFFVRRQLVKSEGDRQRYQQAIRFVTARK